MDKRKLIWFLILNKSIKNQISMSDIEQIKYLEWIREEDLLLS